MKLFRRKKAEEPKRFLIHDIYKGAVDSTINLKKKLPVVEVHFDRLWGTVKEHRHRIFDVSLVIIGMLIISTFSTSHASIATFYPTSCLGGWEHPENAQGQPDLSLDARSQDFTVGNSARLQQSIASLYCGGFKGDVPEHSKPTQFKLSFSWSVEDGSVVHTEPAPFDPVDETIDGSLTPNEHPGDSFTPPDTPIDSSSESDTVTPPDDASITPSSEETSSPVSLLDRLFDVFAFAQETESVPVIADTTAQDAPAETLPADLPSPSPVDQTVGEQESTASDISAEEPASVEPSEDTPIVSTVDIAPSDAFMSVEYTLDGTQWHSLGTVSRSHWQDVSFDIPLEGWENLDHLQVALKTLSTVDQQPTIYLDGIHLSVEYEDMKDVVVPPTVLLKETDGVVSGKQDFTSGEDVTFTLTTPNLDIPEVKTLVDQGKAEVVQDIGGVLKDKEDIPTPVEAITHTVDSIQQTIQDTADKLEQSLPAPSPTSIEESVNPISFLKNLIIPTTAEAQAAPVTVAVLDWNNEETDITARIVDVEVNGVHERRVEIDKPERQFHPGKYKLRVTFTTPQAIFVSEQNFTWGVLAININKSVYQTGDNAYIQMGVLNDAGHTICDADLDLTITSPSGVVAHRSTADGSIVREPECGPDNVISVPDYYAYYRVLNETGTYRMALTARTINGTKTITDTFTAVTQSHISIERTGPTRIYPVVSYPMTLRVTSDVDWQGTITEVVPASFEISQPQNSISYTNITSDDTIKTLSWDISLVAGQTATLGYYFDAPDISPEFYLLGKSQAITTGGGISFEETRNWQIASDAACNATGSGTWGGASDTASFTSCTGTAANGTGTGNRPAATDTLTINAGVALTLAGNVQVAGITIAAQAVSNSPLTLSGFTLTNTGTLVCTLPSANSVTSTIAIGTGTLANTGLITLNAGATSKVCSITQSTGTLTLGNGITFSGSKPVYNNSGAGTINLNGGTFGSGGTVTINSGTTLNVGGTSTLSQAKTFGPVNINSGTLTLGVASIVFGSTTTIANGATLSLGNFAFTQTGNLTIGSGTSGTVSVAGAGSTGSYTFSGGITVNAGGIFNLSTGTHAIVFGGTTGHTHNGSTFNTGTGAITFSGTGSFPISGGSAMTYGGTMTVLAGRNITNSNTNTVTFGALTLASPTTANSLSLSTGSTTTVTGALSFTANAAAGQSQTVTMNGTANLSTGSISMPATTSTGTATITCASGATGTLSVTGLTSITGSATASGGTSKIDFGSTSTACNFTTGTLTIAGGSVGTALLQMGTGTLTINGTVTFGTSGNAARSQFTTGAATINLSGSTFGANGTLSIASATLNTAGTTAINGAYTLPNLNINGGTTTMGAAITVTNNVTVATGAFLKLGGFAFTVSGNTSVSGDVNCPAAATCTGLKTFTGTVTVNSGGSFDLVTGSPTVVPTLRFDNDITMDGTTFTTNTGAVTMGTSLSLLGASSMTFGGTVTVSAGVTLTNSNTGTVTLGALTLATGATSNNVSLSTGSTTTITGAITYTANTGTGTQTITMNGTANLSAASLTISAMTSSGSSNFTCAASATGTFTLSGALTVRSNSTAAQTGSDTIAFNDCTVSLGSISNTGGTVTQSTISLDAGSLTVGNVTFGGTTANALFTNTSTTTVTLANGSFGAAGTVSFSSGTMLYTTGTSTLAGSYTYPNVTVSSGTLSLTGTTTISGTTTVSAGTLLKLGGTAEVFTGDVSISGDVNCPAAATCTGLKTFTGTVTVNSGGSFDLVTGSPTVVPTLRFGNNITMDGTTFTTNTGAVTMGTSLSLLGANNMTFGGTVTVNAGVTLTNSNTGTVTMGALTLASPAAVGNTYFSASDGSTTTVTGAISYTANSSSLYDQGIFLNGSADMSGASFSIPAGTGAGNKSSFLQCQADSTGTFAISGTGSVVTGTAATFSLIQQETGAQCAVSFGNTLTITAGSGAYSQASFKSGTTLTLGNGLTFTGFSSQAVLILSSGSIMNITGTISSGGTLTADIASTTNFTGTSTINGAYTFGVVNVNSGTLSLGGVATTFAGATTIASGATIASATSATGTKTFSGLVTVQSGGVFDMSGFNPALSFGGGITMDGTTFTTGTNAVTFTASQDLAGASAIVFGGAVTINNTFTLTNNNTSTVDFNSNLLGGGASATFATGASSTTRFAGTVMNTGVLTPGTSPHTIEYDGGTQTIKVPTTNPYYNLSITAAGTKSLEDSTTISSALTITAGTLDTVNGSDYPISTDSLTIGASGALTARNSVITMTGNWSNAGTFTAGGSTVLMNGGATVTVSGATTFNNLTITHTAAKEVDFETAGSPIFGISGVFTVTGSLGNLIKLYSDSPGVQWTIYPTGTTSVDYVDVKDSACNTGSVSIGPTHFTNSGNNGTCWLPTSLTFSISDASIGFGTLSSSATAYATGDSLGSGTEVEAHTIDVSTTAPSGYTLTVLGGSLFNGSHTITAIGGVNTAPNIGSEQFGIRFTATGGSGTVSSPYAASGFAFGATSSVPSEIASATTGDGVTTTYSARYMCNIDPTTSAGAYTTSLTYVLTGNF